MTGRSECPAELEVADWRSRVNELYATVRAARDAERAHTLWRLGRDELFLSHPQSPLPADDILRQTGLPYWPYDPSLRFELPLVKGPETSPRVVQTGPDEKTVLRAVGAVEIPEPVSSTITVWSLQQYGGGLFVPLLDATAGNETYGGGRYLLDTAKGAYLGGEIGTMVIDLNFLYHPSCRYSPEWWCPLAPAENKVAIPVRAGERLTHLKAEV
jgi:uncharacterized protein